MYSRLRLSLSESDTWHKQAMSQPWSALKWFDGKLYSKLRLSLRKQDLTRASELLEMVERAAEPTFICAYLTMLILKASVPESEFKAEEPLTQQYFLLRCSLAWSWTSFMVTPRSTLPPLPTLLLACSFVPFASPLQRCTPTSNLDLHSLVTVSLCSGTWNHFSATPGCS